MTSFPFSYILSDHSKPYKGNFLHTGKNIPKTLLVP